MSVAAIRATFAAALALASAPAAAADLPDRIVINKPVAADDPCGDLGILKRIIERFAWEERNTWHRGFVMQSLSNGRRSDAGFFSPGLVLRDYCVADSVMTNGLSRPVFYAIEHGLGFASLGVNVDYCVLGLDPWHVHNEDCRTVR